MLAFKRAARHHRGKFNRLWLADSASRTASHSAMERPQSSIRLTQCVSADPLVAGSHSDESITTTTGQGMTATSPMDSSVAGAGVVINEIVRHRKLSFRGRCALLRAPRTREASLASGPAKIIYSHMPILARTVEIAERLAPIRTIRQNIGAPSPPSPTRNRGRRRALVGRAYDDWSSP